MEKIILTYYINVGSFSKQKAQEMLAELVQIYKKSNDDNNILMYYIPIREGDNRIECVYPNLIVSNEAFEKAKSVLERLGATLVQNEKNARAEDNPHRGKFKEILRKQIIDQDLKTGETFDSDDIDMGNINVANWPEEEGEPLDMENWDVLSIDENGMVMLAGGDWQEGAVFRIEADEAGTGLTVTEVFKYDNEKHGKPRMDREDFYKELMTA